MSVTSSCRPHHGTAGRANTKTLLFGPLSTKDLAKITAYVVLKPLRAVPSRRTPKLRRARRVARLSNAYRLFLTRPGGLVALFSAILSLFTLLVFRGV